MSGEQFDDIMNAVMRLRIAFLKHDFAAPKSIELGSIRDGDKFRYLMPRDMFVEQPRMGETHKDSEWVVNVQGVEIRMPAQWRIERDGKKHLV
ncbi:MAG: hypothetical protein ACRCYS_10440 [Beijerinckiaceae bacterium]